MNISDDFLSRVRSVVGDSKTIALHEPDISYVEQKFVNECLNSGFVSSVGSFVTRFEEEISSYTGAKHAIAVTNGTVALQVALILAGVRQGDEVLIPALSFVATANAVVHAGGIPHFVDSDIDDLGLSPKALEDILSQSKVVDGNVINVSTGNRISAIVPMHTIGHPAKILEIISISEKYRLPVVEDSAESLGSFHVGKHTGTFGLLGILSFNGNKTITTGGGGMILTDDDALAKQAKHLTTTAKQSHPWKFSHTHTAWNYRMPNINAALGVAQLSRLDEFLENKRLLAENYNKSFESSTYFDFIAEPTNTLSNYWLSSVRIKESNGGHINEILEKVTIEGIQCRPLWDLLSDLPMYSSNPKGDLTHSRELRDSVISLPSSPSLGSNPKL